MPRKSSPSAELPYPATRIERLLLNHKKKFIFASFALMFLIGILANIIYGTHAGLDEAKRNSQMQTARTINLALFQFASDHGGNYPQGKTSTEIFQQLIDQKYVTDSTLFYFPMAGKTAATSNKLKPENVCWDVTNAVLPDDPDTLPIVFATGYKVDYAPGGKAHPFGKRELLGLGIAYKDDSAVFLRTDPDAEVSHVIRTDFNPKGRTYQQLTPNGPLP